MNSSLMNAKRILIACLTVAIACSSSAAPRKRKANANAKPMVPQAQAQRDPAPLDRLLYEAVTSSVFSPLDDDAAWLAERNRICTQIEGAEYDFYVKLGDATKAVIDAKTALAAISALKSLEDFLRGAVDAPDSSARYLFGSRDKDGWYLREYKMSDKGRKVTNSLLEFMLQRTSAVPARRMIEGWLASSERDYISCLEDEVVESGFSPGLMIMEDLQNRLNLRYANSGWYGRGAYVWRKRKDRAERIFDHCKKISCAVAGIRKAVSRRNAPPDAAKKAIKESIRVLDLEVRQYYGAQKDKFDRYIDHSDAEKSAMYLEIQEDYERLLARISESLSDPSHKEIVNERLEQQRRHIVSAKEKYKKKVHYGL